MFCFVSDVSNVFVSNIFKCAPREFVVESSQIVHYFLSICNITTTATIIYTNCECAIGNGQRAARVRGFLLILLFKARIRRMTPETKLKISFGRVLNQCIQEYFVEEVTDAIEKEVTHTHAHMHNSDLLHFRSYPPTHFEVNACT